MTTEWPAQSKAGSQLSVDVISILADERGRAPENLRLSDRLLQDLGMDGDDAVDFFNALNQRFGTDLTHLYEHWTEHFGPEGFSGWNGLVMLPAGIVSASVATFAGLSAFWGVAITVALFAAWVWFLQRWAPRDEKIPVTVEDVVAAVEAGAWPSRRQA